MGKAQAERHDSGWWLTGVSVVIAFAALPDWWDFFPADSLVRKAVVCGTIIGAAVLYEWGRRHRRRRRQSDAALAEKKNQLAQVEKEHSAVVLVQATEMWRDNVPPDITALVKSKAYKHKFFDIVHGNFILHDRAARLLTLPMVERLDSVSQLPFARYERACASHTRLQHSLGVAYLAGRAVEHLLHSKSLISQDGQAAVPAIDRITGDELVEMAQICGLLHDLGHAPFAHATDRLVRAFHENLAGKPDVYLGSARVRSIPDEYLDSGRKNRVTSILSSVRTDLDAFDNVIADVIDGVVDVDRLDYLCRDATLACIPEGHVDIDELVASYRIDARSGRYLLVMDSRAAPSVGHFLYARHVMYRRVYDGVIKSLCERLLTRAVNRLLRPRFDKATQNAAEQQSFEELLNNVLVMSDDQLVSYIWGQSSDDQVLRGLVGNLRYPPKYRRVAMLDLEDVSSEMRGLLFPANRDSKDDLKLLNRIEEAEEALAKRLGLERVRSWQLALGVPSLDGADTPDLYMVDHDDRRDTYSSARPASDVLELLAKRPFQEPLKDFLRRAGKTGEDLLEAIVAAISKPDEPRNAKLLQEASVLEGPPFFESLSRTRAKIRVYAHMDLLAEKSSEEVEATAREVLA